MKENNYSNFKTGLFNFYVFGHKKYVGLKAIEHKYLLLITILLFACTLILLWLSVQSENLTKLELERGKGIVRHIISSTFHGSDKKEDDLQVVLN